LESDRGTHSRQILDLLAHLVGAKPKNNLKNLKTAGGKKLAIPEAAMIGGEILPTQKITDDPWVLAAQAKIDSMDQFSQWRW